MCGFSLTKLSLRDVSLQDAENIVVEKSLRAVDVQDIHRHPIEICHLVPNRLPISLRMLEVCFRNDLRFRHAETELGQK